MSIQRSTLGLALAVGLLAALCTFSARAADPTDKKAAADKPENSAEEAHDRYQVPEGDVKELLAYFKDLRTFRPKTKDELTEHRAKGMTAMKEAAEKIQLLAKDQDKTLEGYEEAIGFLLMARAAEARNAGPAERRKLLDEIIATIGVTKKPSQYLLAAGTQLASSLEYGPKPDQAIEVYRELGEVLSKSPDEQTAKTGAKMEGAARRLSLQGKTLEVKGTLMDGGKFDWAKYRGKVVLVDFWATWCGPCLGELPNVKKNYERFHDKGFEVVGISLDDDRDKLEKFLEKEQNPWPTLHDGGWNDSEIATYYGVMGIPTVILVDKEGKVVSLKARGPELTQQLETLLGADDGDAKSDDKTEKSKDDSK